MDLVRVQDIGLSGASDATVLAQAVELKRIVLTHDAGTMVAEAIARIQSGLHMPGLIVARKQAGVGQVIDTLELILSCSEQNDWRGQIAYIPWL